MDAEGHARPFKPHLDLANILWSVSIQGEVVRLKSTLIDYSPQRGGKRGQVFDFSRSSRKRMLEMVSTIYWKKISHGLFITLTCPEDCWPNDSKVRNRWRYLFFRSMEIYLGKKIGALWRVEWKKRKTGRNKGKVLPHFHLIVPNVKYVPKEVIGKFWKQATGSNEQVIRDVQRLTDRRKHEVYIAKYAAKGAEVHRLDYVAYLNMAGRHWGVHRPTLIPRFLSRTYADLPYSTVKIIRDMGCKGLPWYDPAVDAGFVAFGRFGREIVDAVAKLCLDTGIEPTYDDANKGESRPVPA